MTQCDIKFLILLYAAEKRTFVGFIPNNQIGVIDKLRKVIAQSKMTRQIQVNMRKYLTIFFKINFFNAAGKYVAGNSITFNKSIEYGPKQH